MKKSIIYLTLATFFFSLLLANTFQTNSAAATKQSNVDNPNKVIEKSVVTSPKNINPLLIGASIPDIISN